MIRIFLFVGLIALLSCNVRKAGGHFMDEEGYTYYVQPSPQLRMQLYGDYFFHSLKSKYFTQVDKSFLKYTTAKANGKAPQLMYAAHTFVQPYYATISMMYKAQQVDGALLGNIKQQLKTDLNTAFNTVDSFYTNMGTAIYFSYPVRNRVTKVTSMHREYFINSGSDLFRFYFWTTNMDTSIVFKEAETILKNIK